MLSPGERVQKRAEIVRKPGTGFDENLSSYLLGQPEKILLVHEPNRTRPFH
jgi:hypothetical protein